jgi:hypothetical protein
MPLGPIQPIPAVASIAPATIIEGVPNTRVRRPKRSAKNNMSDIGSTTTAAEIAE